MFGTVFILLLNLAPTAVVGSSAAQERTHHQQRRYPDLRRLTELNNQGFLYERLHIVFERAHVNESSATPSNEKLDDTRVITQRVQKVMKQIKGLCTICRPTFRQGGKFDDEHTSAGLHLYYQCDCPTSPLPSSSTDKMGNNQTKDIFDDHVQQHSVGPMSGENTLAAIHKLTQIMIDQHEHADIATDQDDLDYLGIAMLDAGHAVQTAEFMGETPVSSPINEVYHPVLWARQLRQSKLWQEQHGREMQTSQNPGDRYFKDGTQSHYKAIGLPSAWEYMANHNGWNNAKKTVVHVSDSGWDTAHVDSGGTFSLSYSHLRLYERTQANHSNVILTAQFVFLIKPTSGGILVKFVAMAKMTMAMALWMTVTGTILRIIRAIANYWAKRIMAVT